MKVTLTLCSNPDMDEAAKLIRANLKLYGLKGSAEAIAAQALAADGPIELEIPDNPRSRAWRGSKGIVPIGG